MDLRSGSFGLATVDEIVLDVRVDLGVAHLGNDLCGDDFALVLAPALHFAEETQRVRADAFVGGG